MLQRTDEEIKAKAKEIWAARSEWSDLEFTVTRYEDGVGLKVSQMYEAPGLSLAILMDLAEFFGTKNINDDDRWSNGGCETCDYGSSYGFELRVRAEK